MLPIHSPTHNTPQIQSDTNITEQACENSLLVNNPSSHFNSELCAVSVKLPQFWTNCPEAWFIHAEMQFATKGISADKTKYEHVITALPQEVVITVLDIIQHPPQNNLYSNLKKVLVDRHSLSETSKLEKILSDSEMGNRKPSEFYRSMSILAGSSFSSDILQKLWLRKLPKSLNVALTGSNHSSVSEMIQLADRIWEVMFSSEVASIKENTTSNAEHVVDNLTKILCENISKLSIEVNAIKNELRDRQQRTPFYI